MAITVAVGNRLETRHLISGRVQVENFDVEIIDAGPAPAPIFPAMVTTRPYDVGELTLGNFIIAKDSGVKLFGLPIFPNLFFPLTGVTVNKKSGIETPKDLEGKRIGVPLGFSSNPAVWLRSVLASEYDVNLEKITWVEGENDSLAGVSYLKPPAFLREKTIDLEQKLIEGKIDALVVAGGNATLDDSVKFLVEDPYPLIKQYNAKKNRFPINTLIVIKEESHQLNPGLAEAVCRAMNSATEIYMTEEPDEAIHQGLEVGILRKLGLFPRNQGLDIHGSSVQELVDSLYRTGSIHKNWALEDLFV